MLRSPFLRRLFGSFVVITFCAVALLSLLAQRAVNEACLASARLELSQAASALASQALPAVRRLGTGEPAAEAFAGVPIPRGAVASIVGNDGKLALTNAEHSPHNINPASWPETRQALNNRHISVVRREESLGGPAMIEASPVLDAGMPVGVAYAVLPLSEKAGQLAAGRLQVWLAALATTVLCLLLGYLLAQANASPLARLSATAQQLASEALPSGLDTRGRDELGQLGMALSSFHESSRESLETIARDRNQLLAVLGGMAEGVIAVDRHERILHMNRAAGETLRMNAQQAVGRRVWVAVRIPAILDALSATIKSGEEHRAELRLPELLQDRVIELYASPLRDSQNRNAGAVLVLQEVTELRRLEAVRREFVANVSHELKTPLAAIRAMVETLVDDPQMLAAQREKFLLRIEKQTLRLSALVTDLLSLSRLESPAQELELAALDLREPVEDALHAFASNAEDQGVQLLRELPAEPVAVAGDREALRQAVGNLLDNAIKYTPSGGSVRLRLSTAGGKARIEVQDTGIGIEPVHLQRIFERFYRVDKARSRELGGTGLGLAIVKHIALGHHGSVALESTPGKGSTFSVEIPLASVADLIQQC